MNRQVAFGWLVFCWTRSPCLFLRWFKGTHGTPNGKPLFVACFFGGDLWFHQDLSPMALFCGGVVALFFGMGLREGQNENGCGSLGSNPAFGRVMRKGQSFIFLQGTWSYFGGSRRDTAQFLRRQGEMRLIQFGSNTLYQCHPVSTQNRNQCFRLVSLWQQSNEGRKETLILNRRLKQALELLAFAVRAIEVTMAIRG